MIQTEIPKYSENGQTEKKQLTREDNLSTKVVYDVDTLEAMEETWRELAEAGNAHPFQSFDWIKTWWDFFGDNNELYIILVWKDSTLVGLAPLYKETFNLSLVSDYRKIRFIGGRLPHQVAKGFFFNYSPADYLDFIALPGYEDIVVSAVVNHLAENRNEYEEVELDELSENGVAGSVLTRALGAQEWEYDIEEKEVCPKLIVENDWEDYLMDLHRKTRYKLRYGKRAFTEKDKLKFIREDENKIEDQLDRFINLHQKRWHRLGCAGIFADDRFADFFKQVALAQHEKDRLWLAQAEDKKGNLVAANVAFWINGRIYDYQKAIDTETPLSKFGPGNGLQYFMLKKAHEQSAEVVELLRGEERYKFKIANSKSKNYMVRFTKKPPRSGVMATLFRIKAFLYKIEQLMCRQRYLFKMNRQRENSFYALKQLVRSFI